MLADRHTSTLFDLEQHLCAMLRVANFDQLLIGPLLSHPTVQQQFQPPPHAHDIPEVSIAMHDLCKKAWLHSFYLSAVYSYYSTNCCS